MSAYNFWRETVGIWGTVYFAIIFVAAMAYALWPSKKATFDKAAQTPLIED
jgi:cbb3-type cytochrome oxidase subunit 3